MNASKVFEVMSEIINMFDKYDLSKEEALAISSMIESVANQPIIEEPNALGSELKDSDMIVLSYDETLLSEDH